MPVRLSQQVKGKSLRKSRELERISKFVALIYLDHVVMMSRYDFEKNEKRS